MPDASPHSGLALPGGYRTLQLVGQGRYADVYDGRSPSDERVAVKILIRSDEQARRRFLREIKVTREVPPNPHRVGYRAHGELPDGSPWLALEFVDGFTLGSSLRPGKRLAESAAVKFMYQLCEGFGELHQLGLSHRDINPDNIMITRAERVVKITDLGLVQDSQGLLKLFEEQDIVRGSDFHDDLDKGFIAGTPEYMAPEQISDPALGDPTQQRTDTTADVYALGVIFYQLLTGHKLFPFVPTDPDDLEARHADLMAYLDRRTGLTDEDLIRPERINTELWSILAKTLRRNPKLRQADARALAADIRNYVLTGMGVPDSEDREPTIEGYPGLSDLTASHPEMMAAARARFENPLLDAISGELELPGSSDTLDDHPTELVAADELEEPVSFVPLPAGDIKPTRSWPVWVCCVASLICMGIFVASRAPRPATRGEHPAGVQVVTRTVVELYTRPDGAGEACWVAWTEDAPPKTGHVAAKVACERWRELAVGSPIEVGYAQGGLLFLPDPQPAAAAGGFELPQGLRLALVFLALVALAGGVFFAVTSWRRRGDVWSLDGS